MNAFGADHGWPVVLKTARGGYDGRGVWVVDSRLTMLAALAAGLAGAGRLVVETFVPLQRELAALVARSPFGQAAAWPIVQTVQQDGICVEVIAPAPGLDDDIAAAATRLALRVAAELGRRRGARGRAVPGGARPAAPDGLVVNELAMRPHNSGHWTMDGSVTSQFEQHLRAVLDYPLGRTDPVAPFTVMGNVLGGTAVADGDGGRRWAWTNACTIWRRGSPTSRCTCTARRSGRAASSGTSTSSASDLGELRRRARLAAGWLGDGVWPDGYDVHGRASATATRDRGAGAPARATA